MNASKMVAKRRAERCMVALCRSRLSSTYLHYLQAANTRLQIASSNYSACIYYSLPARPKFVLLRVRNVYHAYTDTYYARSCWRAESGAVPHPLRLSVEIRTEDYCTSVV